MRRAEVREGLAAVGGLVEALGAGVEDIGVGRIGAERVVVERPLDHARRGGGRLHVHQHPRLPRVVRTIEAAAGQRFEQRVDAIGRRGAHADVALADEVVRQARGDLREVLAPVGALVEAAVVAAADDRPGLALQVREPGVDDVRIARLELDVHRADAVGEEEDLAPRLAAVGRLEDAPVGVVLEGVALRRHPHGVGVGRMDAHAANLTGVAQARERPGLAGVGGLVDAAAGGHVAAHIVGTGAEINDVRIGIGDRHRTGRPERHLAVGDRVPRLAAVGGLEQAPAGDTHIEGARLGRDARDRRDAAAAGGADEAVFEAVEERRIDAGHHAGHGRGGRRRGPGGGRSRRRLRLRQPQRKRANREDSGKDAAVHAHTLSQNPRSEVRAVSLEP